MCFVALKLERMAEGDKTENVYETCVAVITTATEKGTFRVLKSIALKFV